MFFYLSKILSFLLMPFTIIVLALLAGLLLKNPKWKKKMYITGVVLLLFFSNPFIIGELMRWWVIEPVRIESLDKTYAVAIVLGGFTLTDAQPDDRVHTTQSVDRLLHTLQLYREGKVQKILVSGGLGQIFADGPVEAELAKRLLLLSNVQEEDIILETNSRNTRENALNTAEIIREKFPNQPCLLVTSAYHMRRAQACFDKVGLPVTAYSTGFSTKEGTVTPDALLLPNPDAIENWHKLTRETMGMIIYKMAGYI